MKIETIEQWQRLVTEYLNALKIRLDENPEAKQLYNGFYVWDSKIIHQPDIMFIGINPGDGNENNNGGVKTLPEKHMSYIDHFDEDYRYDLARETVSVLELAGFSHAQIRDLLNERSVKTNFYHIITKDQSKISPCLNSLGRGEFNKYWTSCYTYTSELINILQPKIIICEGTSVFKDLEDAEDILQSHWGKDCGYLIRTDGIVMIGYSRNYSSIKNKEEVADLIKKFLPIPVSI